MYLFFKLCFKNIVHFVYKQYFSVPRIRVIKISKLYANENIKVDKNHKMFFQRNVITSIQINANLITLTVYATIFLYK